MAKYDVTMSCGHEQTVQLFGKMTDRYKKIEWLENHGVCNECKKAETERKHAEATEKAAEKAVADNLPELTGTEKQVNWALTIRAKMLAEVDKKIADNKDRMDAEKLATAELQAKAIKKVVANKFTTAKFWIDNRDSILQQIIKNNNLAEEIKAEIANLQAAETAEVIAEDDGSNDDDYDEDEIVTVDNTDNDAEDDDDDDELVDPPIDTAEVKGEVKMMTISKAKLDAYEKATNAENNRVTVYFNGNRKQFEVYGTYYTKRKVNCARGEKVCKEVEMFGWHKVSQKDVAEILKNYGLTIDEFVAIANGEYEEETAEVETAEVENVTKDEEVTAENNVNNNNNGADSDELLALKVRHTNLEIQKRKSGIKVGLERIREEQKEILYHTRKILEAEDVINNLAAFILNDKLILSELQNKAAELANEVANRKLIDAIDDIGGSADAVNATVEAMIELNAANFTAIFNDVDNNFTTANLLNSANDFTAANLLDAVNAADKATENIPVTFEIQNFAEDVNIAEGVATIDTAVSGTVIPVIDEDAEIKNQLAEIADLANREKELEQKIAALQEELNAVHREYVKKDWKLTKYAKDLMDAVYQTVKTAFAKRTEWGCIEINGVMMQSWHWDEYNAVRTKFDDSGFALWFYDDTVPREYQYTEFVKYSTIKQFKAAISELAAAIERGDKTFTFPADETADK